MSIAIRFRVKMWLASTTRWTARLEKWRQQTQTHGRELEDDFSGASQQKEAQEVIWLPPRDSNPDMLIQSQLSCR
jgi:hypothetical protein